LAGDNGSKEKEETKEAEQAKEKEETKSMVLRRLREDGLAHVRIGEFSGDCPEGNPWSAQT
jgi:hypothetical protein